jgi:hypothetical protein
VVGGCSVGAPPGFSGGDSWTFPLVGPLEDGVLVTPVFIDDHGPYLMAIDPDSAISQIDEAIVSELQLHSGLGPKMLDESDTNRPTKLAEVLKFTLGPLTVRNRTVSVMKVGSMSIGGRELRGVLGKDVIADSLAFGFDRERGIAWLATQKGFTPPAGAVEMGYDVITNRLAVEYPPTSRHVSKVSIDDHGFKMHVDLGAVPSQLRKGLWAKANLASVPVQTDLRDEVGTTRHATEGGVANTMTVGGFTATGVLLVPYDDKRWEDSDVDGSVGLSFFRMVNVAANWDGEKVYLTPRGDALSTVKDRIARWGSAQITGCEHVGCADVQVIQPEPGGSGGAGAGAGGAGGEPGTSAAPGAGGPPGGGMAEAHPILTIKRDTSVAGIDLELLMVAVGPDGREIDQPRLVANLPAGTDELSNQLDAAYTGAKLIVVDVSPYPRPCARGNGCIQALANVR